MTKNELFTENLRLRHMVEKRDQLIYDDQAEINRLQDEVEALRDRLSDLVLGSKAGRVHGFEA